MNCTHCGMEADSAMEVCPRCGAELDKVHVLAPEERDDFQGLTIGEGGERGPQEDGYYEYKSEGPNHRVYVRRVSLGNTPGGILQKLIIGAILVGLVIVALPFALAIIGIFLVGWLISALLRR